MSDRKPVDEADAELQRTLADMQGLPIEYQTGGQTIGRSSLIAKPDARQLRVFQNARVRTCGSCTSFDREAFQKVAPQFLGQLVHEYEWKTKHLGDDPKRLGRCKQDESVVVGPNSLGCDAYRVK